MKEKLVPLYRKMAADGGNFHGMSVLQHTGSIGRFIKSIGAKTLLDFGCGRGDAYRSPDRVYREWGLHRPDVTLYDPSFKGINTLPAAGRQFDVVLCSDVLEHVPAEEVDAFVARLFSYAKLGVWASVCTRPAKKFFPDGTNLHVTLQPFSWWEEKFREHAGATAWVLVETP